MCGICGQLKLARSEPVDRALVRRMTNTIVHRGPDDEGYHFSGPLGLGFRRLSIIDLAGGHQPMSDWDASVWVVFNGEIYNYKELRAELESKGHRFRTSSDTEVIIYGYKEWGKDVFNHLNGMFGVAIWDERAKRLIVSRDAMGIKLIYYRLSNGELVFGSEIRPVLVANDSHPEIDPVALNLFLRFRYTPSPLTLFKGVRKLPSGTMLICENGQVREERWYNFTPAPFEEQRSEADAAEELLTLYRGAVRRHLLADVPVGILLSGGLDSGLLLALMKEVGQDWPAYTVGYGESFHDDELADAAESARLLGARHIPVQLDRAEFERALPSIVQFLEEPVTASSVVPMYFVCQRARQDVKVVLIGQGPDELFGGYKRHLGVHYGGLWRDLPGPIRSILGAAIHCLPRNEMLKRGVNSLAVEDRLTRYQDVFSLLPSETTDGLFREDVLPANRSHRIIDFWNDLLPQMKGTDELGGLQFLEIRSSLPDELLMYADKMSMAHGLEARVPYLDRTVVEFAQRLNSSFKIRRGTRKWLHRRVCQNFLPQAILNRKKRGFAVNVVDGWLHSSKGNGRLAELLLDKSSLMFDLLEPQPVERLLHDHTSGRQDNYKILFSLVMFEQWLRGINSATTSVAA
jgi:asparagine synthase (glutamine-hydrolysing)